MPIISEKEIQKAVEALAAGSVVAMPTETVYGLAGRIDLPEALQKIFRVKERPFFDPLIVHVDSKDSARKLTNDWSDLADFLADHFWPGPLTLVLPKAPTVNPMITSGLDSVGIRCPNHPVALKLIKNVGVPLAAPSANKFGRTSPTAPEHVEIEFQNENILVLDGGPCEIGIESTVLKIEHGPKSNTYELFILRKGLLTQNEIEDVLKNQNICYQFKETTDKKASPGHMEHHYMPPIPLVYCANPSLTPEDLMQKLVSDELLTKKGKGLGILKLPSEAPLAARQLYSELRNLSNKDYDALVFYAETWQTSEAWQAILDRIYRASKIKVLT